MDAHLRRQLRADAEARMTDTCTVYRKTGDTNSGGIVKPQFDAGTSIACRWHPNSGTKATEQGKVFALGTADVALPAATSLGVNDYVLYGGRKYEILFVSPVDSYSIDLQIQVRELK